MNATVNYETRADLIRQVLALPPHLVDVRQTRLDRIAADMADTLHRGGMGADAAASSALAFVAGCVERFSAEPI